MNRNTVEVFNALMKKGFIDRQEDRVIWSYAADTEVQEELENFKQVIGIDLISAGSRLYMVPTQDNELFLKNNLDFRRDIKGDNDFRIRDLYLLNYISVYLIYTFFNGEGNDPLCREFISKEEFIHLFTEHCKRVEKSNLDKETDYSENFKDLANTWLSKIDGDKNSKKLNQKYGIINRLLFKYKADDLFIADENDSIRPTRKLKDLMPYFLRKDRIIEIQNWLKGEENNAPHK